MFWMYPVHFQGCIQDYLGGGLKLQYYAIGTPSSMRVSMEIKSPLSALLNAAFLVLDFYVWLYSVGFSNVTQAQLQWWLHVHVCKAAVSATCISARLSALVSLCGPGGVFRRRGWECRSKGACKLTYTCTCSAVQLHICSSLLSFVGNLIQFCYKRVTNDKCVAIQSKPDKWHLLTTFDKITNEDNG